MDKKIVKLLERSELKTYLINGTPVCEAAKAKFRKLSKVILDAKILGG